MLITLKKQADFPELTVKFGRMLKKHNFVKTMKKEKNYICSG